MNEFWQRLKQRKLVQWAIAWVAFAFALLQGVDIVAQRFNWPGAVERYLILALAIGFSWCWCWPRCLRIEQANGLVRQVSCR